MCPCRRLGETADMCPSSSEQSPDHTCLREKIKSLFGKYDVGSKSTPFALTKASILLPLLIRQGKPHLLFTVRSTQLHTMPGEVCFPGGRQDPTDEDDIQTALRESKEEVGLCPEQVEIIGRLMPCVTKSPIYLITPVVGIVEDSFQPKPNPSEVADVFLVPLEFFISTEHYTPVQVDIPSYGPHIVHKFVYMDADTKKRFTITGLTAHCALMLSVILLEKTPSFNLQFDLERNLNMFEKMLQLSSSQSKL